MSIELNLNEYYYSNDDSELSDDFNDGDEEQEAIFVEFEDESGKTIKCEVVDGFEFKEKNYCVVFNEEDNSSYVFRLTDEDELVVPEEKEFEEVSAYYDSISEEEE